MKSELEKYKSFYEKNKILIGFSFFSTILIYFAKIITPAVGMDTDIYLYDSVNYNLHWTEISRFGQVLLKKIFWNENNNFFIWNILGILLFILSIIFFIFLVNRMIEDSDIKIDKKLSFVISGLILSSPLFVFQFYFVLQVFEFSLCLFLVIFSVYIIEFINIHSIIKLILVSIILGISFGVYNTFVLSYVLVVSAVQLLRLYTRIKKNEEYSIAQYFVDFLKYGIYCIVGLIVFYILNKLAINYYHAVPKSHATNMIYWLNNPFFATLKKFVHTMGKIILLPGAKSGFYYYNYSVLVYFVSMIILIVRMAFVKPKYVVQLIMGLFLLTVSGFGIVIATATADLPRTMVPQFPFMIGFGLYFILLFVSNKYVRSGLLIAITLFCLLQMRDTADLTLSEKMTFEEDYSQMLEIDMAIKQLHLPDDRERKVIITGVSVSKNRFSKGYFGEVLGVSMLHYGYFTDRQTHAFFSGDNILILMDLYGMKYKKPTREEYTEALSRHPELIDSQSWNCFYDDKYIYVHIK